MNLSVSKEYEYGHFWSDQNSVPYLCSTELPWAIDRIDALNFSKVFMLIN